MPTKLDDIAKKLGISVSTVSRVANGKPNVNEKTRQLVLEALRSEDYTPNMIARSLQAKSTKTIGIVVPDITEVFFGNIIQAAGSVAERHGYNVLLCDSAESIHKEERHLKYLMEQRINGVILASVGDSRALERYRRIRMPVVYIDNQFKLAEAGDSVLVNNVLAGEMGTAYLIGCGCRRPAIICGKKDEYTSYTRLEGYTNVLARNGIPADSEYIIHGDFKETSGYEAMLRFMELPKSPDGVFITSSKMTFGAVKAVRERGLRYPDDVKVIGFDIYDPYNMIYPGITSVVQPDEVIGKKAVELLLRRIDAAGEGNSEPAIPTKIVLPPTLLTKESCR